MRTVPRSTKLPGRVETPAGSARTGPARTDSARTGPARTEPAPVNYVEKAKAEMEWIEDIQKELKRVEDLQKALGAANVKDELAPVTEELRRRLLGRKESFQKYRSLLNKGENSEK